MSGQPNPNSKKNDRSGKPKLRFQSMSPAELVSHLEQQLNALKRNAISDGGYVLIIQSDGDLIIGSSGLSRTKAMYAIKGAYLMATNPEGNGSLERFK